MATSSLARLRSVFGWIWWLLDASRRVLLNLIFLLIVVAVAFALLHSAPKPLGDKTALVLDLAGAIVEQRSSSLRDTVLGQTRGDPRQDKTQLRDVLSVLDAAARDPKIAHLVLVLDDLQGAGLSTLHEVGAALQRFKASGKPVVAWGSSYDQRQYYLAAQANEVLLHPMGMVYLDGYGRYRNYYREAFDKLGVSANVIRVGKYKSFGEPYFANAPSKEALEADSLLYNGLWTTYTSAVEQARKLPAGSIGSSIAEVPQRFAAVGGDAAKLALTEKLVDGLKTRDELRQMMIERGAKDDDGKSFRQVSFSEYLARQRPQHTGDAVAVVVAEGEIVDGDAPAGSVGGRSTSELIRKARDDAKVKAVVLRVNSPGGSAFGSELVRRELELTRAAGKPVVVSMGDVAASGGYWISMAADEVIADAATITGSIGVFAMLPTGDKALDKLGVRTGGVTTTWLGGAGDPRRPLDPRFADLIQTSIGHVYADFTGKAAVARKTTPQKIDAVGQGRVWSGAQARERGLVDRLGSYGDALKSAATRAKLEDGYRVTYMQPEPGRLDRLLDMFGGAAARALVPHWVEQWDTRLASSGVPPGVAQTLLRDLGWLAEVAERRKPFMAITHCLCGEP
jgi:protease IV